ncbi:hypothetical protein EUGRSUZ_J02713 [Eucalyptus grandis]|uniref:Uncharacterized protein n=1 Tax=Eucalyptus grandis TaxID=71139 RepID=A0ACC3J9E4_EUCGR|nr:hypothetical protein EUGRSUZ_J02713 [Eucalyptus grandis]
MSRLTVFKYDEILTITKNFEREIGEGAFGKVYLGKLGDETKVAVKVLSESSWQGLDYLHKGCVQPIIHRYIKASNILLNENMQAKLSDFGLSRPLAAENGTYKSTSPLGTPGYLPPEYQPSAHELNQKGDVYCFGIVLLELLTGQQAMMPSGEGKSTPIREWAISIIESGDMQRLMDRRLQGKFDIDSAKIAANVAEFCTRKEADTRPDINCVLADLKRAIELASKHKYEDGN